MFNERLEEESVETHQFVLDLRNMIELTSKMTRGQFFFRTGIELISIIEQRCDI